MDFSLPEPFQTLPTNALAHIIASALVVESRRNRDPDTIDYRILHTTLKSLIPEYNKDRDYEVPSSILFCTHCLACIDLLTPATLSPVMDKCPDCDSILNPKYLYSKVLYSLPPELQHKVYLVLRNKLLDKTHN